MAAPLIVGSMVGGTALSMYGQSQSAKSQSAYYNYLAGTSTMNAGLTKAAGEANARAVGIEASDQMRRVTTGVRQTIGAQKAAIAGGVGLSSRSAQDIIKDTLDKGNRDEQAINMNAALKAKSIFAGADMQSFNDMNQAGGYDISGANVRNALPYSEASTLLGGAGQVGSSWYMMSRYNSRPVGQ